MTKPIIGINCDLDLEGTGRPRQCPYLFLYADYFDAITKAGGIPILLPCLEKEGDIEQLLTTVDGLVFSGGGDVAPSFYREQSHSSTRAAPSRRMQFDMSLAKAALKHGVPIFGICMGMQMLNVAAGGSLIQHIRDCNDTIRHHQMENDRIEVHEVSIQTDSSLANIIGNKSLGVNSTHHQAVDKLAPGFKVAARAADGVVEAIEREGIPFVIGVQWHPERLTNSQRHLNLFKALIKGARS